MIVSEQVEELKCCLQMLKILYIASKVLKKDCLDNKINLISVLVK